MRPEKINHNINKIIPNYIKRTETQHMQTPQLYGLQNYKKKHIYSLYNTHNTNKIIINRTIFMKTQHIKIITTTLTNQKTHRR